VKAVYCLLIEADIGTFYFDDSGDGGRSSSNSKGKT
jgi:hypothetical protein